MKADTNNKTR